MSKSIPITLANGEQCYLVRSPSAQARDVLRSRIVLFAADRLSNREIAQRLDCNINTARLWRNLFFALGIKGLKDLKGRGANRLTARIRGRKSSPPH